MSAYLVVDTKINNAAVYEDYKKLAKPIAEHYGGVYRVRGGAMDVRQTELWAPTRIVIIEFPDVKSAQAFVDSEEYAQVAPPAFQPCRMHAVYRRGGLRARNQACPNTSASLRCSSALSSGGSKWRCTVIA